jgi:hypothetical protein
LSPKDPAPDAGDAAEARPRPGRKWKPIDSSIISIAVLVAISAALVYRRDGAAGVWEILKHDLTLFGGILPRVLAGCLLGAFIAEILPHEKVSRSLGAVAPKSGGGAPQVIAYVVAWALFAFQRLILWEIPFMPARFVWFRAAVSLPFPFLAVAVAMAIGKP